MSVTDRLAITELLNRAACAYDDHDIDSWSNCFASEATMIIDITGHAAIMELMRNSMATQTDTRRHVISNVYFDEIDAHTAKVCSYLTLFATENGALKLLTTGVYRDDVVHIKDGWQISRRHLTLYLPYS